MDTARSSSRSGFGEFLVGGNDGLCASYDWPTGAVRLWHGPLA
ncbi:hypothetical protein P9209_16565 [Prescottella defluvii]|nr:hypothetical protein P9209_16565 [Prescottella defluvii]